MCWDRLGVCQPWKCEWSWPPEASSALGRCSGASQRSHWPPGKLTHSGAEWSALTQSLPWWRTSPRMPASRHRGKCLTHTHPHTADKYTHTSFAFEEGNFKSYQCDWRTGQSWWSPPQSLKPGNKRQSQLATWNKAVNTDSLNLVLRQTCWHVNYGHCQLIRSISCFYVTWRLCQIFYSAFSSGFGPPPTYEVNDQIVANPQYGWIMQNDNMVL